MAQGRADCGVLHEMKLTKGVYTQESSIFWVRVATREEDPSPGNWEEIVAIIQAAYRGREIDPSCA